MDAETNLANPSEVIDDEAFSVVDAVPPIVAGVLKLFTVKSALIVASAPIINASFAGSK